MTEEWLSRLCKCSQCTQFLLLKGLSFLVDPPVLYNPPTADDVEEGTENSLDFFANAELPTILQSLPHQKKMEGIYAFNALRDQFHAFLRPFSNEKKIVKKEDILRFFEAFERNNGKRRKLY